MLENLIHQLGQELSMGDLITSRENHHYMLPFDNEIDIEIYQVEKSYVLKGIIGTCPQKNLEAFLLTIMEANLFGVGTRGAAIGLNEDGNILTLSIEINSHTSFKDFKDCLEDFINVIDFWRKATSKHE